MGKIKNKPPKWAGKLVGDMHINRISQEDLARELGLSRPYVSMMLSGARASEKDRDRLTAAYNSILEKRAANDG